MFDTELAVNNLLVRYAGRLTADISDERMAEQPVPGVNHPAWILGHLTVTAEHGLSILGAIEQTTAGWGELFGPGSKPTTTRQDYPGKDDLLKIFQSRYEQLRQAAASASPEQLDQPSTNPLIREMLPTIQEALAFLMTGHLGVHAGQLSAWRRMIGLPPMF